MCSLKQFLSGLSPKGQDRTEHLYSQKYVEKANYFKLQMQLIK